MKKIMFGFAILMSCVMLSAADIKDTWFNTFYEANSENLPEGCTMRKNEKNRIIFFDMPLPVKSGNFDIAAGKKEILKTLRGTPDAEFIKKANIIVVYNYITTDYKIYSIVISDKDF